MKKILLLVLVLLSFASCKQLKYVADINFDPSAYANSPEYPVQINGKWCVDGSGMGGFCVVRQPEKKDMLIRILPQLYGYRIRVQCSTATGIDITLDVLPEKELIITLQKEKFNEFNVISCVGNIYPSDRPEPIAAMFELRARIIRDDYTPKANIYWDKGYQVFGSDSYISTFFLDDQWTQKKEMTYMKTEKPLFGISESYKMRFNYYGF